MAVLHSTDKMVRGLFHRLIYKYIPMVDWMGGVPGHRDIAVELLKQPGSWVTALPGGGEEAIGGTYPYTKFLTVAHNRLIYRFRERI